MYERLAGRCIMTVAGKMRERWGSHIPVSLANWSSEPSSHAHAQVYCLTRAHAMEVKKDLFALLFSVSIIVIIIITTFTREKSLVQLNVWFRHYYFTLQYVLCIVIIYCASSIMYPECKKSVVHLCLCYFCFSNLVINGYYRTWQYRPGGFQVSMTIHLLCKAHHMQA